MDIFRFNIDSGDSTDATIMLASTYEVLDLVKTDKKFAVAKINLSELARISGDTKLVKMNNAK